MKTSQIEKLPHRGGRIARLAAGAICALAISARADLFFIDNFEDPIVHNSSPAPGQPGGGMVGGAGFWTDYGLPANTGGVSAADGVMTIISAHPTDPAARMVLQSDWYPELQFMNRDPGEFLLLSLRGFEMDWQSGAGLLNVGLLQSTHISQTYYGGSNCVFFGLYQNGNVGLSLREGAGGTWNHWIPASGTRRATGFDLYLDSQFYMFYVYFDNQEHVFGAGAHLFDAELWTGDLALRFEMRPLETNLVAGVARVGEVSVTLIPEPGALSLLSLGGLAVLARRIRRPGPARASKPVVRG